MTATVLAPLVGYDQAAVIAKTAHAENKTVREIAKVLTNLTDEQLDEALDPAKMVQPGLSGIAAGG